MADDLTLAADSGSPDPGGATSPPDASPAPPDTRAIAASVFAESQGDTAAPPAADPSTSAPPPDAAIRVGEDDDPEYQSLLASGSMPVDRHKAVLTNARRKTREEVEAAARQRYGWVDDLKVDRSRAEQALGLMQALDANPEQAIRTLAHALGIPLTPPATPEPQGPPRADVVTEDGREFYSAPQLAKLNAWNEAQLDQKLAAMRQAVDQQYRPLIEERHLNQLKAHATVEATTTLAKCRSRWPAFSTLETDIKARMQADPSLDLRDAYIEAYADVALPRLQTAASTDRVSQLQRKAAASNPGPGAARPVTPLRYAERSTRDIAAEVFARAGAK